MRSNNRVSCVSSADTIKMNVYLMIAMLFVPNKFQNESIHCDSVRPRPRLSDSRRSFLSANL